LSLIFNQNKGKIMSDQTEVENATKTAETTPEFVPTPASKEEDKAPIN
jgi:hypothetical protein